MKIKIPPPEHHENTILEELEQRLIEISSEYASILKNQHQLHSTLPSSSSSSSSTATATATSITNTTSTEKYQQETKKEGNERSGESVIGHDTKEVVATKNFEELKKQIYQQLKQFKSSYVKHLRTNTQFMTQYERDTSLSQREPLDEDLKKRVSELSKKVLQKANKLSQFRNQYSREMIQNALQKHSQYLEEVQKISNHVKEGYEQSKQIDVNAGDYDDAELDNDFTPFKQSISKVKELSRDIPETIDMLRNAENALKILNSSSS